MAVDRPDNADEDPDNTEEQRAAAWRLSRDQPGTEPPGLSRADSRRRAMAATDTPARAATEARDEDRPKASRSPEEPTSSNDNKPETNTGDEPGTGDDSAQARPAESEEDESPRTGWDAPEYADHARRPEHSDIRLTDDRRTHILDGEGDGRGGHRHGTGVPGKTEFPADWTDDTTTGHIVDTAYRPDIVELQKNGRWLVTGERDGVEIDVIVHPDGRIITAYPLPGGRGVIENPKEGK